MVATRDGHAEQAAANRHPAAAVPGLERHPHRRPPPGAGGGPSWPARAAAVVRSTGRSWARADAPGGDATGERADARNTRRRRPPSPTSTSRSSPGSTARLDHAARPIGVNHDATTMIGDEHGHRDDGDGERRDRHRWRRARARWLRVPRSSGASARADPSVATDAPEPNSATAAIPSAERRGQEDQRRASSPRSDRRGALSRASTSNSSARPSIGGRRGARPASAAALADALDREPPGSSRAATSGVELA